jgi:hypothetical protein
MYNNLSHFLHHPAPDNSYALICTRCFATAGFGRTEEELVTQERKHVCDPEAVQRRARSTKTEILIER